MSETEETKLQVLVLPQNFSLAMYKRLSHHLAFLRIGGSKPKEDSDELFEA